MKPPTIKRSVRGILLVYTMKRKEFNKEATIRIGFADKELVRASVHALLLCWREYNGLSTEPDKWNIGKSIDESIRTMIK